MYVSPVLVLVIKCIPWLIRFFINHLLYLKIGSLLSITHDIKTSPKIKTIRNRLYSDHSLGIFRSGFYIYYVNYLNLIRYS